ncbi:MAG: cation acetate symporter [Planctomycetota bacterium]|nr:cation acetate symporter [Planctomycetota bacterium]
MMFLTFIALTLVITYWASRRTKTAAEFYSAGRSITGFQNGWAIAGDYMSAASFLGIAGLIAFYGYDGFMYSVGWLVAYLTVLLIVAEPLRNSGKYTMADLLAARFREKKVRAVAAFSTLTVSLLYMIAQMVGAGLIVNLLIPGLSFEVIVLSVGVLMLVYVVFGGMLATTWVQIVKAVLLMAGTILLSVLVLKQFGFSLIGFFDEVAKITGVVKQADGSSVVKNFTQPGLKYNGQWGPLDLISLGVALICGTAGLPHILVRFYTVPSAKAARTSVVWAMILIGCFYIMTTFLGFGAATLVGKSNIGVFAEGDKATAIVQAEPDAAKRETLSKQLAETGYVVKSSNSNLAAPLLARKLGGEWLLSFVSAIAFATILAVVAGLTIASSSAFSHDVWQNVIRGGKATEKESIFVARIAAGIIGVVSIGLAIALKSQNVAFLVGLAFAVAAAANVPAIILAIFWRGFTTAGMIAGMVSGLVSSIVLIVLSPAVMGTDGKHIINAAAIFPLENPAILSVPIGFLGAVVGSLLTRDAKSEAGHAELLVRAHTGLHAEG